MIAFSCGELNFSSALYASSKSRDFDDDMSCQTAPRMTGGTPCWIALDRSFGRARATCSYPWTTEPQNVQSTSSSSGVSGIVSGVRMAGASALLI